MQLNNFLNTADFSTIFIIFIVVKFSLETYLKIRNISSINKNKDAIPKRFVGVVTEEEYKKSVEYNLERIKFGIITSLVGVGILILFTFGGLFNTLVKTVVNTTSSNIIGAVLLGLLLILVNQIINLPISIYSTFSIEERHGFNKTTKETFVKDILKNLVIESVLFSLLYAMVIAIIDNLGTSWWLYAALGVFLFQAIVFFLYPVLILPLFNKLEPLVDEQFKKPIERLLKEIDFKAQGLFVMDASLRSTHGNAFFTGFGKNKRIVFFDTLLKTITPSEMESILGHELGHYKLGHIKKSVIASLFLGFIGFYILDQVLQSDNFFISHGLDEITIYSKFLLFYLVIGSYTFLTKPISSYISRQREFASDNFSLKYTKGESMISGLLKLSKDNASNLTPDPLFSSYYYSHPPISERVASIENKLQ